MKLIVGLGNPGQKYEGTFHNLGFIVVEKLVAEVNGAWKNFSNISEISQLSSAQAVILKPLTYMNESGRAVREIINYFKIELDDLWVVHDDLDLPLGELRINYDSSSAGHKGVQNIMAALSSQAWWRFRLGIGRPLANMAAEDYVLTRPNELMTETLSRSISESVKLLQLALTDGINQAQIKIKKK